MKKTIPNMNKDCVVAYVALGIILVLSVLLRMQGIDWGVPDSIHPYTSYHPDEVALLFWSDWLSQGHLLPKQFIYGGTFYFLILRSCIYFGDTLSSVLGGYNLISNAILLTRYLQVFLSVLTILLVYESGRLLYERTTALIASLVLALMPGHIIATQTVRPDAISVFLVALIVFLSAKLLRTNKSEIKKYLVYSGIAIGATSAFRLPLAVFGILPVFIFAVRMNLLSSTQIWKILLERPLYFLLISAVLSYVILSPHSVLYPEMLIEGIKTTVGYEGERIPDAVERGPIFYQYATRLLPQALSYPIYFILLIGLGTALVRRKTEDIFLLCGTGIYFILLSTITWTVVRYTVPLFPLLAILSGVAVQNIKERLNGRSYLKGLYLSFAFLISWAFLADLALVNSITSKNTRDEASSWILENIPRGKTVLMIQQYSGDDFFNPTLPPAVHNEKTIVLSNGFDTRMYLADNKVDYVIQNEFLYSDMERLGERHPRKEVREFNNTMGTKDLKLINEFKKPVRFLGIDFSRSYQAIDYMVINPGIRIYSLN